MKDSNVAERLKTFIEIKGLTYSQFADACGIPRPSLSQLLTGRNKKISDIMIGQIHNMFPALSIVWLLFGEGSMEEKDKSIDLKYPSEEADQKNNPFFSTDSTYSELKNLQNSSASEREDEISQGKGLKSGSEELKNAEIQIERLKNRVKELEAKLENLRKNPRKAVRVTVYYDDSTFEEFSDRS